MSGWLRALFGTKLNAAITLAVIALLWFTVPPFLHWSVAEATWNGLSRKACTADGACWAFVKARFLLFIYGRYPRPEYWRVDVAFALLALFAAGSLFAQKRFRWLIGLLVVVPVLGSGLLLGGIAGLSYVPTADWGGLMLNVVITYIAVAASLPLGIILAFGRRSRLPLLRWASTAFIELWRGSPLLAVLFMGLVMLPMFLPNGVTVDNLIRALVVMTLFESAYMAEAVRGGLQSVPTGQTEAARALGMHTGTANLLVVLPQAMRIAIPPIINIVVDLFKDTTLVSIVGLFDLMGVISQSLKDPDWLGLAMEGYTFAIFMFFIPCLLISFAGGVLERQYGAYGRR